MQDDPTIHDEQVQLVKTLLEANRHWMMCHLTVQNLKSDVSVCDITADINGM